MPVNYSGCSFRLTIRRRLLAVAFACFGLMALDMQSVAAQMINVRTPFQTSRDSFFERSGVNFGLGFPGNGRIVGLSPTGQLLPNIQLTQGGFGQAIPTVGGFTPNASLRSGIALVGGSLGGSSLGIEFGQGSTRSISSQTPSITLQNGQFGSIFGGANRPFVTRIDPVIGLGGNGRSGSSLIGRPIGGSYESSPAPVKSSEPRSYSNPHSTALSGELSIAEIKRRRSLNEQAEDQELKREVQDLIDRSSALVKEGSYGAARSKLGRALRKVSERTDMDEVREYLQQQLHELRGKR